jgi:TIR domain
MPIGPNGRIFINYRRDDDPGFTHALYQRLEGEFSPEQLFMDVEGGIKPGDDFVEVLSRQVAACDVLLAVIGPRWQDLLTARADDPADFVVIEIKAALDQGKRVIPVLVGGASFPRVEFLPKVINALARKHAIDLRPDRFKADCQRMISLLKEFFADVENKQNGQNEAERRAKEEVRPEQEIEESARTQVQLRPVREETRDRTTTPASIGGSGPHAGIRLPMRPICSETGTASSPWP